MSKHLGLHALSLGAALSLAATAHASLVPFQTYVGSYGISTDGFGSTSNKGNISAFVPVGATVTAAYLYSAYFQGPSSPAVTLGGSAVNFTSNTFNPTSGLNALGAARADVTSIVASKLNNGPGGTYNFNITEGGSNIDGEALVVVYSKPTIATSTVAILDGYSAINGDMTSVNFSDPLDPTAAGFGAELRLGDSFSCCNQASNITVDGTTITTEAGSNDDSADATAGDGNLITVGGSDDPFSPLNPTYATDHERYNLTPEIKVGDTSIRINTLNPSHDDNIFLAVLDVSGSASINQPPPPPNPPSVVPEPATLFQCATGLLGLAAVVRRRALSSHTV